MYNKDGGSVKEKRLHTTEESVKKKQLYTTK